MTAGRCPATEIDAAERRGADTHWWHAYKRHSTAPTASAPRQPVPPATALHAFRPTPTEMQRAANKALGPP